LRRHHVIAYVEITSRVRHICLAKFTKIATSAARRTRTVVEVTGNRGGGDEGGGGGVGRPRRSQSRFITPRASIRDQRMLRAGRGEAQTDHPANPAQTQPVYTRRRSAYQSARAHEDTHLRGLPRTKDRLRAAASPRRIGLPSTSARRARIDAAPRAARAASSRDDPRAADALLHADCRRRTPDRTPRARGRARRSTQQLRARLARSQPASLLAPRAWSPHMHRTPPAHSASAYPAELRSHLCYDNEAQDCITASSDHDTRAACRLTPRRSRFYAWAAPARRLEQGRNRHGVALLNSAQDSSGSCAAPLSTSASRPFHDHEIPLRRRRPPLQPAGDAQFRTVASVATTHRNRRDEMAANLSRQRALEHEGANE
jgi:hypothetical protein